MNSRDFHSTTARDFEWAIRKYLLFLQNREYSDISSVSVSDVKDFVVEIATSYSVATLIDIQCYVRQFHTFLGKCGITVPECMGLLSCHVQRPHKEKDCITDEELNSVLAQIDLTTDLGKRNLAIILLGASTGLRAVDIAKLKLSNIDWERGEIHLIQSKTGGDICLPLMADAGRAIQEYILDVRPKVNDSEIFISAVAPFRPIASVSIRSMFAKYLSKAGIIRSPFDGKTFHGLRRRMGHNLLGADIPVTTIAQILGHKSISSTDRYLSLERDHLKLCALDFSNISVGGVFYE